MQILRKTTNPENSEEEEKTFYFNQMLETRIEYVSDKIDMDYVCRKNVGIAELKASEDVYQRELNFIGQIDEEHIHSPLTSLKN